MKVFVLASLGVGIAGSSAEGARELLQVAADWSASSSSAVPVWGRGVRLSPPSAAFLNAWQMHNQEFDSLHEGAVVHAMASVLPAALAAAELAGGASGTELITAAAVGVDIAAGLGLASRSAFRFFRPTTAGGFGATAAAARLLGLDRAALKRAFAWQLAQASGTMQAHVEGSPILPVQVAFNARAALQSCALATQPFAAAEAVFEGDYGYLRLFEGEFALEPVLQSLGRDWRIAEFSHKPFPAGPPPMAASKARARCSNGTALPRRRSPPSRSPLRRSSSAWSDGRRARASARATRLCMAYAVAKVLLNGRLDLAVFRGPALADPATRELARRITLTNDGNADPNALAPQTVVVRLRDGTEHRWSCDTMLAHPARPLTHARHLAKFKRCLDFAQLSLAPDVPARLIETVDRLETVENVCLLGTLAGNVA